MCKTLLLFVCFCGLDSDLPDEEKKKRDREDHESLVLWKRPLLTLYYFSLELFITLKAWMWR